MITMSKIGFETLLGAQMSAYSTLYCISKELDQELVFFNEYSKERHLRIKLTHRLTDYGLKLYKPFNIPNKIIDGDVKTALFHKFFNKKKYFQKYYPSMHEGFDENINTLISSKNYDIQYPFGLYKYWEKYFSEILNIFKFKDEISEIAVNKMETIRNQYSSNAEIVSIHFRRGDYLLLSSLNLSKEYYIEALNIFKDPKFSFLIFSDDINYCKKLEIFNTNNVHFSEGNTDHIDMCMMSLCDHNIIANSSFSFWGALLNKNKNKIVVCPQNYIGLTDKKNQYMNSNYYPLTWIALDIS